MRKGFSLIEMAIVLVIIGLITTGGIEIARRTKDTGKAEKTAATMTLSQQALQVYVIRFGCLPCPANGALASSDPNVGLSEDATGATYAPATCTSNQCRTTDGVLPWRSLGLSEMETVDAWGGRLRYIVATGLGAPDSMVRQGVGGFPTGDIEIHNLDATTNPEQSQAAYGIASQGSDQSLALSAVSGVQRPDLWGQAGPTAGQGMNAAGGLALAYGSYLGVTGATHFDDIIRFRTGAQVITSCGSNACGNPAP